MNQYFKSKIGQIIEKDITTGQTFFTEIYKRRYNFEVISISRGKLTVWIKSFDIVPSGYKRGGSDIDFGQTSINITKFESLDSILKTLILNIDQKFANRYGQYI